MIQNKMAPKIDHGKLKKEMERMGLTTTEEMEERGERGIRTQRRKKRRRWQTIYWTKETIRKRTQNGTYDDENSHEIRILGVSKEWKRPILVRRGSEMHAREKAEMIKRIKEIEERAIMETYKHILRRRDERRRDK